MSIWLKLLIGLGAALLAGWVAHGPLGRGEAFIGKIEARAQAVVSDAGLPGVEVRMKRDPLRRVAVLSGPADDFQREGQGLFPGLNDRVRAVTGISGIEWTDSPAQSRRAIPLLVEMLILTALAYLIGVGLGRLFFGRTKRDSFL